MNTEIIQKIYAAFRAKDLPAILQLQAEDAEWLVAGPADKIPLATKKDMYEPRRCLTNSTSYMCGY